MTVQHFGWLVSPYSAKTRCYLRYKGIAFVDRTPTLPTLYGPIRKAVGRMIMPTVKLSDGRWLQDSSDIIDSFEAHHPEPSVSPPGPTQRLASSLLELHGDEWLPMAALHYRWNLPANSVFALNEFAKNGLPWLPQFIGRRLVAPLAKRMQGYLPALGVTEQTIAGLERFSETLIERLNAHLSDYEFLLGGRPCIGDFALFGPLWAHLYRDPASTSLFDDAEHVRAWFERILSPRQPNGDFLDDDEVPRSLDDIFATLFQEQMKWLRCLIAAIDNWCAEHPGAERVPRALGREAFQIGGLAGRRKLITFVQYKAQRAILPYYELSDSERRPVDEWLKRVGGDKPTLPAIAHPFEQRNFRAMLRTPA